MRLLPIALSLAIAACAAEEDPKDAPPTGGTGGLSAISGTVCVVSDLRRPSESCEDLGNEFPQLTIKDLVTDAEVMSETDGSFAIAKAAQDENYELQIAFDDPDYRNIYMGIGGNESSLTVFAIRADDWNNLLTDIGFNEATGASTIAAYAAVDGVAESGVTFEAPTGTMATVYDGDDATTWNLDTQTGTFGAGLMISVPVEAGEPASFTARKGDGSSTGLSVPIFADTTTFMSFNFPL